MRAISHREFRTWIAWRKDQLNNPSRSDYYLMRIAGEIHYVMSKKNWSIKNFKIPFQTGPPTRTEINQQTQTSKSNWRQRLGFNRNKS